MAMEPGGRADKLGNEYERLWVVYQMLGVLSGDVTAVTWEPAGQDAEGVDVVIDLPNGLRSLQSCKRENASRGKWTLTHLNGRGVLKAAKSHLADEANNRFVFVSRDSCPDLRDLSERAGRYDNRADIYYSDLPSGLLRSFHQLGSYWGLDTESSVDDQVRVFEMLRRCEVIAYELKMLVDSVRTHARYLIDGDPDITRTLLADYAVQNLGNHLDKSQIVEFLGGKGLALHGGIDTDSAKTAIDRLQTSFIDSIKPYLIGGQLIARLEAASLLDAVVSDDSERPRLVMVHGRAGIGKSGVLFELVETLKKQKIPFLPIRLDRNVPVGSAEHFGREVCGLPASPARVLRMAAGQNRSVLILDQLDALRWTAAHTDQPMDVLTETVREALNPLSGADISVVVVCRTFDLEDDPRIAYLQSLVKSHSIEVGLLTPEATRDIVNAQREIWASLAEAQRCLLQQPQALYLWMQLNSSGGTSPVFRTHTDLMRAFWHNLFEYKRPKGMDFDELKEVIHQLVAHMDSTGRLTAPLSLVSSSRTHVVDFLQSTGVIRIDDRNQCVFTHQSYLDFLVADELNRRLLSGEISLPDWLRASDQSLFRRDQLRQVLALQRDDNAKAYCDAIESILCDKGIRFHLKHLVIRLLSQAEPPMSGEVDLIVRLLDFPEWRQHVYEQILWNKPSWFFALQEQHLWSNWLDSEDESLIDMALRMLGFMTRHFGNQIAEILGEYVTRDSSWPEHVARALAWGDVEEESDAVFKLRLALARKGQRSFGNVWWERLAKNHPKRAMRLLDYRLRLFIKAGEALQTGRSDKLASTGIESHGRNEAKWLRKAAARCPKLVWNRVAPICLRFERLRRWAVRNHDWADFRSPISTLADQSRDLLELCEQILVSAGRSLAHRDQDAFKALVTQWETQKRTSMIERSLMRSLEALPGADADYAIEWLISKPRRFRIGNSSSHATVQEPARRVIARFAKACTDSTLTELEKAIMSYHDPDLKRILRHEHEAYAMKGAYYPNHHGIARYVLLSAVPSERLTDITCGQLGVWQRKFGEPRTGSGLQSISGYVGSTIPNDRLQFISDSQWLRLISGDWSERSPGRMRRKVMGKNLPGEASHVHFANDMDTMTRRQPSRFAKLALKIPDTAPSIYLQRILRAFEQKGPPDVLVKAKEQNKEHPERIPALERELALWRAANAKEIELVIAKVGFPEDAETAKAICWLIDKRDDITWSQSTIDLIVSLATKHPDPDPDNIASGDYDKTDRSKIIPNVARSGLNCVRGTAALAIKDFLFADQSLYAHLEEAIVALANDKNVAVRASAIATCVPILNINRDKAIAHFIAICKTADDRVFESHYLDWFMRYAFWSHHDALIPIIERMLQSSIGEVAKTGATWVTAAWMHKGWCENLLLTCKTGSKPQRHGMAEVLGNSSWERETVDARLSVLPVLFEDEDKDVQHAACRVFWTDEPWQDERLTEFALCFINSRAFAEDPTPIIHGLGEVKGSILQHCDVVLAIADKFAGPLAEASKDMSMGIAADVPDLFKLLLRLYQQAQDIHQADMQIACLDRWDALLQAGVGASRDADSLLDSTEH